MSATTCTNCGAQLHYQTDRKGRAYWAANSGSAFCIWPNPSIWHTPAKVVQA